MATYAKPQYISVRQIAERWAVSRPTVSRTLQRAGVSSFFLHDGKNGSVRYLAEDIEKFERENTAPHRVTSGKTTMKN